MSATQWESLARAIARALKQVDLNFKSCCTASESSGNGEGRPQVVVCVVSGTSCGNET